MTISHQIPVPYMTICKWVNRYRWKEHRDEASGIVVKRAMTVLTRDNTRALTQASDKLREGLANALQKGVEHLDKVKLGKPSLKTVKALGEAIEPLTRAGKIVHSWGNEGPAGIVLSDLLGEERQQSSVEVAASVEPVQIPACGVSEGETTQPVGQPIQADIQVAQVVNNETNAT